AGRLDPRPHAHRPDRGGRQGGRLRRRRRRLPDEALQSAGARGASKGDPSAGRPDPLQLDDRADRARAAPDRPGASARDPRRDRGDPHAPRVRDPAHARPQPGGRVHQRAAHGSRVGLPRLRGRARGRLARREDPPQAGGGRRRAEVHPNGPRRGLRVPRRGSDPVRPLERLPTIRAKLGSTIVFAVGLTLALVFVFLGFALRSAFREAELGRLARIADQAAAATRPSPPAGVSIAVLRDGRFTWVGDERTHIGIANGLEYAAVPLRRSGEPPAMLYAVRSAPGVLPATVRFLRDFWGQLLVAGAVAAAIALLIARWLARGMTQPLRDMAQAARRMEMGEYGQRVQTRSRDEVGQLAAAFNRMSGELESLERLRRELVANVSHELKTPISALRAHLENLLDGVERPDPETL